jgi:hypothetical protein
MLVRPVGKNQPLPWNKGVARRPPVPIDRAFEGSFGVEFHALVDHGLVDGRLADVRVGKPFDEDGKLASSQA